MRVRPRRVRHRIDLGIKESQKPDRHHVSRTVGRTSHFWSPTSIFGIGSFSMGMRRPVVALEIVIPRLMMAKSMVAMQRA